MENKFEIIFGYWNSKNTIRNKTQYVIDKRTIIAHNTNQATKILQNLYKQPITIINSYKLENKERCYDN